MLTLADKLAKALAYRKYSLAQYAEKHEYSDPLSNECIVAYKDCLGWSSFYVNLSDKEIEEILAVLPI